jgi:HK97 family phage major capsid protein
MDRDYAIRELRKERERRERLAHELARMEAYEASQPGDEGVRQRIENLRRGFTNAEQRIGDLEQEVRRGQALERAAASPRNREDGTSFGVGPAERRGHAFDEAQRQMERLLGHGELSTRAVDRLDGHLRHRDPAGADTQYICAVSQPEYETAFGKILQFGEGALLRMTDEERSAVEQVHRAEQFRTMIEGTTTAGGYAIPITIDPTITLVSNGSINPVRQISDVITITTREYRTLATDGLTATYAAEMAEVADNSPTLAQPDVVTERAHAFVPISFELFMDWGSLVPQLNELFSDAKDVLEATKFLSGAGHSSNEPQGILTGLALITSAKVSTAGSAAVATTDIYTLKNTVPFRFMASTTFVASPSMVDRLYRLVPRASTTDPTLVSDNRDSMLGRPLVEYSAMTASIASTSNIVIAGDFKKGFRIVDRIGMTVEVVSHLFGTNQRPVGARGLYCYWRNSSTVISSSDSVPLVYLQTT